MNATQPTISTRHLGPTFGTLARKEIVGYLRHPLFVVGAALLTVVAVVGLLQGDQETSTTLDGIAPATVIGLLGLVVMASRTRSSDRAAEAAGAVAVGQRTRSLALAAAVVVPFACGLAWFAAAVVAYQAQPPAPGSVPFGPVSDGYVYATMFGQGVVACVGGPILGLVIGRWVPRRGAAPVAVVLVVLVTMLMQGIFESTRYWREVWPWVHFYGEVGVKGDRAEVAWSDDVPIHWAVMTGSPYFYIGYLLALCAIGVLVALLRDHESPRRGTVRALGIVGAIAVVLLVLTITGGYEETLVNPIPAGGG